MTGMNFTEDGDDSGEDAGTMSVRPWVIFTIVTLGFSVFVAVFGNAATIVAFKCDRGLREKPSNMLILALSCSDLCVGLIITSGSLAANLTTWHLGEAGCRIFVSIGVLIVPIGPLLVTAICLDRYLLVSRDYPRYLAVQTRRSVRLTIGFCWFLTIALCCTENALWDASPRKDEIDFSLRCTSPNSENLQYNLFSNIVYVLIPFLVLAAFSVRFLVLLRRKLRSHRRVGPATISGRFCSNAGAGPPPLSECLPPGSISEFNMPSTQILWQRSTDAVNLKPPIQAFEISEMDRSSQLLRSRYVRPTITVICLVLALAVCYLPYCIYFLFIVTFFPSSSSDQLFGVFHLLRLYNSCLDPILYAATQRRIRAFYARQLRELHRVIRSCIRRHF